MSMALATLGWASLGDCDLETAESVRGIILQKVVRSHPMSVSASVSHCSIQLDRKALDVESVVDYCSLGAPARSL